MKFSKFVYRVRNEAPVIDYYASFKRVWPWDCLRETHKHIGHFQDVDEAEAFVEQHHPKWWATELSRTTGSYKTMETPPRRGKKL